MFKITQFMQDYWSTHPEPKASSVDIASVESSLGVSLPAPYVEFITNYGFVVFGRDREERHLFEYYEDLSGRTEMRTGEIAFLLEPEKLIKYYLYSTTAEYEGDDTTPYFPKSYLPVGNDLGQGLILLELDNHKGRVWYWPEREWGWGRGDNTWLGYVADDFYQFINGLHP